MKNMIDGFISYMEQDGKSENTIKSYKMHVRKFLEWFEVSYSVEFKKLYRENILEYKSYLKNNRGLDARTVNAKLAALIKFNEYLQEEKIQEDIVLSRKDYIKIQTKVANPTTITKADVEKFRQEVLENTGEKEKKRNYAIVTIMAYGGLRISEVLGLKAADYNLVSKEIIVKSGKGDKQRTVYMNDKIVNAIKEYLKERNSESEYLFVSRKGNKIDRTVINRLFNKYSDKITPHTLRHFFCTNALESGYAVHEVANQAGHSNIHTTLIYTNPTAEKMREKANRL